MIRPTPYVDLPGIVYTIDSYMRARNSEFANFVITPESKERRTALVRFFNAVWPITPTPHTWICEDRWRPLGVAQARPRPHGEAWDLVYLAAMTAPSDQAPTPQDDVLMELTQYALNAALMRGVQRFFARVEDERPEMELFGKLGFQRYAREMTYGAASAAQALAALERGHSDGAGDSRAAVPLARNAIHHTGERMLRLPRRGQMTVDEEDAQKSVKNATDPQTSPLFTLDVPLRRWSQHDAWGLMRLYDAGAPRRVVIAESLSNDEFTQTRAGGARSWTLPLLEPESLAYVIDRGVRLGGWIRLRFGRGSQPHHMWVMAHPDEPDIPLALIRFGLRIFAAEAPRPVICQAREYEGPILDALRTAGFEHGATHALLVRHLTMRALRNREVPALEQRVVYGVKGLGAAPTRLAKGEKTHYATGDH